jgi:hypothetical protein
VAKIKELYETFGGMLDDACGENGPDAKKYATLDDKIVREVQKIVAAEQERIIKIVDEMCGSHNLTKRLRERVEQKT